jgi:hypothetical protein
LEQRGGRETEELKIKIREVETLKRAEEDKELEYVRKAGSRDGVKLYILVRAVHAGAQGCPPGHNPTA